MSFRTVHIQPVSQSLPTEASLKNKRFFDEIIMRTFITAFTTAIALLLIPGSAHAARIPILDGPWWHTVLAIIVALGIVYAFTSAKERVVGFIMEKLGLKSDDDDESDDDND